MARKAAKNLIVSTAKTEFGLWTDTRGGGAEGVRTPDLLNAIQALYQLSYDPIQCAVSDGVRSTSLSLPLDSYPSTPHLTNWAAAQAVDSTGDFTLVWDPFTGGTTNDFVYLKVEDDQANVLVETQVLLKPAL